nr:hypothetical protein Iba_chr12dCG14720 [Ipomoea batatas]
MYASEGLIQATNKGIVKGLRCVLLETFCQPNGCFPGRHLFWSKRLQQHGELVDSILLQKLCTELQQPFQGFSALLSPLCGEGVELRVNVDWVLWMGKGVSSEEAKGNSNILSIRGAFTETSRESRL